MPRSKAPAPPPDGSAPLLAPSKTGGAPSKRTRQRVDRLLTLLRGGHTRTAAAAAAGIHRRNLARWMAASAAFRLAVEEAEDTAVVFYEDTVRKAAREGDVKAAQWWLEKRVRREYAPGSQEVAVTVAGGVEVTHHRGEGWTPDQGFASQVVQILINAGKLPADLEPDDVATTLLAAPEPVPAPADTVDGEAVDTD